MSDQSLIVRLGAIDVGLSAGLVRAGADVKAFGAGVQGTLLTTADSARKFQHEVGLGMVAFGGAIVAAFGLAEKAAISFDKSQRNLQTVATNTDGLKLTDDQLKALSNTILDLSTHVPQSADALSQAMFKIVTAGFQGGQALQVLNAAAVDSTAGLTSASTAADAITTVLKAYGESGYHAAQVSDVLFQTVHVGKLSFDDLAGSVGTFVNIAAQLGVPLEQAASALATISQNGQGAQTASVQLNRLLNTLVAPSDALAQAMAHVGVSLKDLQPGGIGLQGVMDKLAQSVGGNVQALHALFPDFRTFNAALALTADGGARADATLKHFTDTNQLAGAAQRAFNTQSKSTADQLDLTRNEIQKTAIEIGTGLGPAVRDIAKDIGGFVQGFEDLPGPARTAVEVLTGVVGVTSLVGGTALLAVPKVVALKEALDGLAASQAAESGASIGGATAGIAGAFADALPIIGTLVAALGLLSVYLSTTGSKHAQAKEASKGFADALTQEANGVKGATAAYVAQQSVQNGLYELAKKYHISLNDVTAAANGNAAASDKITASIKKQKAALDDSQKSSTQYIPGAGLFSFGGGASRDLDKLQSDINGVVQAGRDGTKQFEDTQSALNDVGQSSNTAATGINALSGQMAAASAYAANLKQQIAGLSDIQSTVFQGIGSVASDLPDFTVSSDAGGGAAGKSAAQRAQDIARANLTIEQSQLGVVTATQAEQDAADALEQARSGIAQKQTVEKAERSVAAAYDDSSRAVMSLQTAEQALEDARNNQASGRSLQEAQIATAKARIQAQDAADSVAAAQQAFADAQASGNQSDIDKAGRALTGSRADLRTAQFGAQDAALALSRAKGDDGTIANGVATAQLNVNDAQRQLADSADSATTAQSALAQVQKDAANNKALIDATNNYNSTVLSLKSAVLGVTDAQLSLIAAQKDDSGSSAAAGGSKKVSESLQQATADLKAQTTATAQWAKDLATIANDPSKGGLVVESMLAKMGKDGIGYTHQLATQTGSDVTDFAQQLAIAAVQGTDAFKLGIVQATNDQPVIMGAFWDAISKATGIGVDQLAAMLGGVTTMFDTVANQQFTPGTPNPLVANPINPTKVGLIVSPNSYSPTDFGGVLPNLAPAPSTPELIKHGGAFAGGDVRNAHQPEIAAGGMMRLWAEPETGGESYIPHANDWRRPRAIDLWAQTGKILGQYAAGGVNLTGIQPKISDFDGMKLALYQGATFRSATSAWQGLGSTLKAYGVKTYANGGVVGSYNGATGGHGGVAVVYGPGSVKVDVKVAADVDRNAVAQVVGAAVDSAMTAHVRDLNALLGAR